MRRAGGAIDHGTTKVIVKTSNQNRKESAPSSLRKLRMMACSATYLVDVASSATPIAATPTAVCSNEAPSPPLSASLKVPYSMMPAGCKGAV